ncbi:MAG TPA: chorismate mutase [Rubricoccaceae bacterium]
MTAEGGPEAGADGLAPWRDRIDHIDRLIVALLNERAACAAEIGRIKHAAGVPVYAPRREADVQRNAAEANAGPLPPEAVQRLFERIIDETRSLERRLAGDADEAA